MNIILNGKETQVENNTITILELLGKYNLDPKINIVELNEEIIDKNNYSELYINEKDKIEIIRFMGGG